MADCSWAINRDLIGRTISALIMVNRLPETVGYNIAYVAIGVGLALEATSIETLFDRTFLLLVAFCAVMFSKMQASTADAIYDRGLDASNPGKAYIAKAVDHLGHDFTYTILVTDLLIALSLWGWIALYTQNPTYLLIGVIMSFLGFTYSYPPRIKERGVLNHVVTTGVDVLCVVLPVALLAGASLRIHGTLTLITVFLYAFAYHVMHQAGDTFYDRQYGTSTFTQSIGVPKSISLATLCTLLASAIAFSILNVIGGLLLLVASAGYGLLLSRVPEMSEREQSDYISKWFHTGWVATCLNIGVGVGLVL